MLMDLKTTILKSMTREYRFFLSFSPKQLFFLESYATWKQQWIWDDDVVQLLSCVRLFETPWSAACQASLSFTISWSLLKLTSVESMTPSNHLLDFVTSHLLWLWQPPFASHLSQYQGLFQWVSSLHQVAKGLELQHQSFQWIFEAIK